MKRIALIIAAVTVTGSVMATPPAPVFQAADAGSSSILLGLACAGLFAARRFFGKR